MLADLRIENLAVVENVRACFTAGLNVISGETGAGKTMLMEALALALGGRASSERVRANTAALLIEARFELTAPYIGIVTRRLDEKGLPNAGDELIVRRRVTREGKSRVYINDASATVGALQQVTEDLVEVTGQHDQFGLLRPRRHLALLDAYADTDQRLGDMATATRRLRQAQTRLNELDSALKNRAERDEFLRFYLREFERIQPVQGEDEALLEEATRLRFADQLRTGMRSALEHIYEGGTSAYDLLATAQGVLQPLTRSDKRLETVVDSLDELQSGLDELARLLGRLVDETVDEPQRLEEVESRLLELQRLCRKHGGDLNGAIETMRSAEAELAQLSDLDAHLARARDELSDVTTAAIAQAKQLSEKRAEAIPGLVAATESHLRDLGFQRARFDISLEHSDEPEALTETGADKVGFLLAANPGQPARPLAKVASGGELSRILLALKCALAGVDTAPVQVLDEIDSGIGGGAAEIVGRKIRQLADRAQVLCVTHLPQIASFADNHLVVLKTTGDETTRTVLRALAGDDREEEVARMLGGTEITETTREHAREMLGRARVAG